MNIASEKSQLRKIFRKKRASLSDKEVVQKSQQINQNFIQNLLPKIFDKNSQKIFSIYQAANNEVATNNIAIHFQNNNISFAYPKIVAKDRALNFFLFEKNQKFLANNFYPKILEPKIEQETLTKNIIPDILLMPLLAFDSKLSRLGMGGGFFDRSIDFFKKQKEIITIGLAYDIQRFDGCLPLENNDQSLDFIVTETSILR